MYASYDVDYWMIKQEEPNYINIDIEIKETIDNKDYDNLLKTLEKWFILISENISENNFSIRGQKKP